MKRNAIRGNLERSSNNIMRRKYIYRLDDCYAINSIHSPSPYRVICDLFLCSEFLTTPRHGHEEEGQVIIREMG